MNTWQELEQAIDDVNGEVWCIGRLNFSLKFYVTSFALIEALLLRTNNDGHNFFLLY